MSGANGGGRLGATFARLRQEGRKALVVYLMAGDPDPAFTERVVPRLAAAGADIVELGFPFSDPVADGPVIQAAGQRALHAFDGIDEYLALVGRIRAGCDVPLVLMTYYNIVFRYGEARLAARARQAGLDGVILPDLPVGEAESWRACCAREGLASTFLEAPNTLPEQARAIARASTGFIYLVSLKGVTGAEKGFGENLQERVTRLRGLCETPLLVGFGISTPEQARAFASVSDGVIVGSALVGRIHEAGAKKGEAAAVALVRALRAGMDQG